VPDGGSIAAAQPSAIAAPLPGSPDDCPVQRWVERFSVTARFASNLSVLIIGAFLAAARFVFAPETVRWLAFSCGAGVVVIVGAAFLAYGRGPAQRAIDVVTAVTAGWTVVSALTLTLSAVGWLAVAEGGAMASLAVTGLIAHEAIMQRALWPG
jgi:hypothetical protein